MPFSSANVDGKAVGQCGPFAFELRKTDADCRRYAKGNDFGT